MENQESPKDHVPVLLDEVLMYLVHNNSGCYIDATFGRGGHAQALLAQLGVHARVVGVDRDPAAVAAGQRLAKEEARFSMCHGAFSELDQVIGMAHLEAGSVDGVLMDIGVSSPQLDDPTRGFSFAHDGPLDMRMDPSTGISAADWLNEVDATELSRVLRVHGEERFAKRIAQRVLAARPINSTVQLAEIIAAAVPAAVRARSKRHPATKSFQAIRIHINAEDTELRQGLEAAFELLKPGGRLAVISFHSLEDRVVKQTFRGWTEPQRTPRRLPVRADQIRVAARHIAGPVKAGPHEIKVNPRARSATLRVLEKQTPPEGQADTATHERRRRT